MNKTTLAWLGRATVLVGGRPLSIRRVLQNSQSDHGVGGRLVVAALPVPGSSDVRTDWSAKLSHELVLFT